VDCVVSLTTLSDFYKFEEHLRAKGFSNDMESNIICRWNYKNISVDIMTPDNLLGFSNSWYPEGIKNAINYLLPNGLNVKIFSATYFIATKLIAFRNRGQDMRYDSDFEDIIYVLNNRKEIKDEILTANKDVIEFIKQEFTAFLSHPTIYESISCTLGDENERTELIINTMRIISDYKI
jgi:predicted nucleotidyltransferase